MTLAYCNIESKKVAVEPKGNDHGEHGDNLVGFDFGAFPKAGLVLHKPSWWHPV